MTDTSLNALTHALRVLAHLPRTNEGATYRVTEHMWVSHG